MGDISFAIERNRVDFPEPFGPTIEIISDGLTDKFILFRTIGPSYDTDSVSISIFILVFFSF